MSYVDLDLDLYIGADIVKDLIVELRKCYGRPGVDFTFQVSGNIAKRRDPLPRPPDPSSQLHLHKAVTEVPRVRGLAGC